MLVWLGWLSNSLAADSCPPGWTHLGCEADVQCCLLREQCEKQVALETAAAARRHLGVQYDQRMAEYETAWSGVAELTSDCVDDLDLIACQTGRDGLEAYLGMPAEVRIRVPSGSAEIQTACGTERVVFDGKWVPFAAPHRHEASTSIASIDTFMERITRVPDGALVGPREAARGTRPPGAPQTVTSGVPGASSSSSSPVVFDLLYVEHGDPTPVIHQLKTLQGRLAACFQSLHPGWRAEPSGLVVRWRVRRGRSTDVFVVRDALDHSGLRDCVSTMVARMPFSRVSDSRISAAIRMVPR